MNFHVITIFPELITSYVNESILGRATKKKLIDVKLYDPRDFTNDKHKRVDDKAYGGGPGMVMQAGPVLKAVDSALNKSKAKSRKLKIILLSPHGKQLTNMYSETLRKKYTDIILISGRYEGIDARVKRALSDSGPRTNGLGQISVSEISIGPYTLTGGELPAMVVVDAVARRIPGVLGKDDSVEERRVASKEVYTRPEILVYKGKSYRVPKILLSGHHKNIEKWRKNKDK